MYSISNENTVVPNNVTVTVSTPANGAVTNRETNGLAREVATVLPSRAMSITRVTSQTHDNTMGGSHQEARGSTAVRSSQDMAVAEDLAVSHLLASGSSRSSRKRTRDENDDSEAEVERSVLYDIRSGSSKRRRFNSTASSPRSQSKAPAGNGGAGSQRCAPLKDRRPKREHAVFLSTPSPFRLRHIQDKVKFAPMITHLGLDETERSSSAPEDQTGLTPPRRPLRRSGSRIIF